jgi:hypothetical protein
VQGRGASQPGPSPPRCVRTRPHLPGHLDGEHVADIALGAGGLLRSGCSPDLWATAPRRSGRAGTGARRACHACFALRRALRDRFPEHLAPPQIYGA